MNKFIVVASQVAVLFLLMLVGVICNKAKLLTKEANKRISDLVVIIVAPCVIIKSFIREFDPKMLKLLGIALLIAFLSHAVMILLSYLLIKDKDASRRKVMVFGSVFSNAGFVALPLQEALLGADGVFFGAAYLVVFNILLWSWGVSHMSGDKGKMTFSKILFSPGIIGIVVGMIIFIFSLKIPEVINTTLTHIAALNTPLPMIVVGYYLAQTDFKKAIKDYKSYICMFLRLILFPLLALFIFYICGVDKNMLVAMIIAISSPVGATATMFSEKFSKDTVLSVQLVSVTTLLSMITMPFIVGLAQTLV